MARLSGRATARAIIAYLAKREEQEANFYEQRLLRMAQVTVYRAYFKRDPNAFQHAQEQLLKAWATQEELLAKFSPHQLPAFHGTKPSSVPLAQPELTIVDGRKGWQWLASIQGYLHWRSGAPWRPAQDRWHPDRIYYLDAIRLLNELESGDPYRIERYKPTPTADDSLPPKKPSGSVADQIPLPLPDFSIHQQLPIWSNYT